MAPKRAYRLTEPVPDAVQASLAAHDPLLQQLLFNRGISGALEAESFLNPCYDTHLHDPFLLTDMERAVTRILDALEREEHLVIYSDYDCDGIPGGVLLHDFFTAIAYPHFENYIPHRHHEGYGFNQDSVAGFGERNASLIITVDCGIVDHAAVDAANALGIDVIITDHHEPNGSLPNAHAVVNPKRDDAYPFKGLCGTGVVYKLILALLLRGRASGRFTIKEGWEKWWLDMVGLATVADMVPLIGENRVLAHYGLQVLRKSRRPGLQHLLKKSGGSQRHLTEDDIGFTIAPRINAASRMDDPEDAFHMLATRDEGEAGERVQRLEKLNNERRGVVAAMTKDAKRRLAKLSELPAVIVIGDPEWRPSLVGLVANALAEEYRRPAFLWGRDGRDIIKGSCRSDGTVSTLTLMEAADGAFLEFGGHRASGGFSVANDRIHALPEALEAAYERIKERAYADEHEVTVDAELTLDAIDARLLTTLTALAPFGEANPKPVFRLHNIMPEAVSIFGKTKNHTKLRFTRGGGAIDAIAFFTTPDAFAVVPEVGKPLTLIAHVEQSFFMGRRETRLRILDICAP